MGIINVLENFLNTIVQVMFKIYECFFQSLYTSSLRPCDRMRNPLASSCRHHKRLCLKHFPRKCMEMEQQVF